MKPDQLETLKWILVVLIVLVVLRLLNKFGLIGTTQDDKNAEKLQESHTLGDLKDKKTLDAASKVLGKPYSKTTKEERDKLTPNKNRFGQFILDLRDANGITNDDEEKVYSVFRQLYSQYEVTLFANVFAAIEKKDLYAYLRSFLDNEELSEVYKIIKNKKPA